jgi:hypothetical protein
MVDFEVDTLSTLISKNKHVKQSLIDILGESSDSDTRLKAGSHLRMIQSFQFNVALVVTQHILSYTRPLAQALQKADCDIVKACVDATTCKKVIREQRGDSVDVVIEKRRTARRMAHRSTAGEIDAQLN